MTSRYSEEELRAIYDQCYVDQYDPNAVRRIQRMLPFFELSGDEVVADFGCGNGVLVELIGPRVRGYVGVDFSDPFVRAAERSTRVASRTRHSTARTSSPSARGIRATSTLRSRWTLRSTSTTTSRK